MVSILIGGIAFDTPRATAIRSVAAANAVFPLYENREAARGASLLRRATPTCCYFDSPCAGSRWARPVEFRGIPVGEVTDVTARVRSRRRERFRIPVHDRDRARALHGDSKHDATRREALDRLVAAGMRAQLKSGNLLTGQLVVALDMFKNAQAGADRLERVRSRSSRPSRRRSRRSPPTSRIWSSGSAKLPVEQIGEDLNASLKELRGDALAQAERTLASANR